MEIKNRLKLSVILTIFLTLNILHSPNILGESTQSDLTPQIKKQLETLSSTELITLKENIKNNPELSTELGLIESHPILNSTKSDSREKKEPKNTSQLKDESTYEQLFSSKNDHEAFAPTKLNTTQFGYDIFSSPAIPNDAFLPINENYILGPGDELVINIWGKLEENLMITIDREGMINLPKIGPFMLAGTRYGNASNAIKQALKQEFANFELGVTLKKMRSFRIFILGNVNNPGGYIVSSMTSVFQALYQAGGPKKNGTLRKITLIREGHRKIEIDLYEYLLKGNKNQDHILKENDTIFVNDIGPIVNINGAVKKAHTFEVIPNKTSVLDVINLAGGLTATTYYKRIQLKRIEENSYRTISDLSFNNKRTLQKQLAKILVQDGDQISILPISFTLRNYVSINGNVLRPGNYDLKENPTLGKLIASAQDFLPGVYKDRGEIYRIIFPSGKQKIIPFSLKNNEWKKLELKEWDQIKIFSNSEMDSHETVTILGSISNPGTYQKFKDMTLSDLIFKGNPIQESRVKHVELTRIHERENPEIINFDLTKDKEKIKKFILEKNDHVLIKTPFNLENISTVSISGEINFPGKYNISNEETLSSIIERAGGFTGNQYIKGIIYERNEINKTLRESIILKEEKKLIYDQSIITNLPTSSKNAQEQLVKARASTLTYLKSRVNLNAKRVILNLENGFTQTAKTIIVKDGDVIRIPTKPKTIEFIGGINNPSKLFYSDNKSFSDYLKTVGGYTPYANKKEILIFRVDGSVSQQLSNIENGDIIFIPERITNTFNWLTFTNSIFDFVKSLSQAVASVVIIQSVIEK